MFEQLTILAKFIGKDGSCGLRTGCIYRIEVFKCEPDEKYGYRVYVHGFGIPYDTWNAIKKNWYSPKWIH